MVLDSEADLRRERRVNLQIPVLISGDADFESFFISSLTQLSEDGAFIATSASFKTGAVVKLEFDLPDHLARKLGGIRQNELNRKSKLAHRIQPLGRITWQGTGEQIPGTPRECQMGIGIEFIEISDEEKQNIGSFIHGYLGNNGTTSQAS